MESLSPIPDRSPSALRFICDPSWYLIAREGVKMAHRQPLTQASNRRRGATVAELAILLPFLVLLFVAVVDFARVFYFSMTITNCARNGALYLCDPTAAAQSPYPNYSTATLVDASNLSPQPTVSTPVYATDSDGQNYVEVTVSYDFQTLTNYPTIPSPFTITRTVRMRMVPVEPNFN
jgi:Flp pilus assembly protein TadG